MRLVEDREVIRGNIGLAQMSEHPLAGERVDADDNEVAVGSDERVAGAGVESGNDFEAQAEELAQLAFPISDQTCRRNDKHASDETAGEHLADVKPGHDGFAGASVIGKKESQPRLLD